MSDFLFILDNKWPEEGHQFSSILIFIDSLHIVTICHQQFTKNRKCVKSRQSFDNFSWCADFSVPLHADINIEIDKIWNTKISLPLSWQSP